MKNLAPYPGNRVEEKRLQREADRRALLSGEKSSRQLREENGHFAFDVEVNFSSSNL